MTRIARKAVGGSGSLAGPSLEAVEPGAGARRTASGESDDAIVVRTADDVILTWSSGAERLFGYTAEEAVGRDGSFLEPNGNRCRQPSCRDQVLRCKDGSLVTVEVLVVPVANEVGDVTRTVEIARDVTERREVEITLRDLSGRLIRAQEEERSRIARDLHDDLSQRLALLAIELEQFAESLGPGQGSIRARLLGLWSQANDASAEIHKLSHELHPSKLDHLGLTSALKSYCDEISRRHGIDVTFVQRDVPCDVPKHIALCIYRIVQEALRNVVKHSGAESARVELVASARELALSVSDAGSGFDVGSACSKRGLGLVSMRERLRVVEGELTIDSAPQRGTRIGVCVPLRERPDWRSTSLR